MNEASPLITIGITCYNAAETIEKALRSAMAQDWPHKEILIVDDASSDNSAAIIADTIKDCPYARLIRHETNKGGGSSSQTIVANARGEFISFFDDDDESMPLRIKTQYKRLIAYEKECGAKMVSCYASGRRKYPNGYMLPLKAIGSSPVVPRGTDIADYLLFYGKKNGVFYGTGTPTCSLFIRRSVLMEIGGFDENFRRVWDSDLSIGLSLAGAHFIGCPEELFIQYSTESSDKSAENNLRNEIALAEKYKDYLKSVGRYAYARQWPKLRYYHFTKKYGMFAWTLLLLFVRYPLAVARHFLATAPRRVIHEMKMGRYR